MCIFRRFKFNLCDQKLTRLTSVALVAGRAGARVAAAVTVRVCALATVEAHVTVTDVIYNNNAIEY